MNLDNKQETLEELREGAKELRELNASICTKFSIPVHKRELLSDQLLSTRDSLNIFIGMLDAILN